MPGASPLPPFEPHNRVGGKFRLRRRLATGGMGEVWVARNESTGADVALKVLRQGDATSDRALQFEERFRHEARLSAMLAHRSIVKVFDLIEETPGTLVLVMELLRGETLREHIERKGPRPAREAVAVITPILSALAHAHNRGIVHRDVTPSNIFLATDPDGHVSPKLLDFGIAKTSSNAASASFAVSQVQTLDGRVLGTPRYMAPERIRGSNDIDGRADLFSAAVVLYEILTGLSPFAASSPSASLAAVLERHVDPDSRVDPRLWIEIQRALSKRPYERHATAQELATALRAGVSETDGGLENSLSRTLPPSMWDPDEPEDFAEVPRRSAESGQSLVVPRHHRLSAAGWVAGGLVVTGIAVVAALGMRGRSSPDHPALASDRTSAGPPPSAPLPSNSGSPPTPALPSASPTASPSTDSPSIPVPSAPAQSAPVPRTVPVSPTQPVTPPGPQRTVPPRAPPAPPAPKAIATTPGF